MIVFWNVVPCSLVETDPHFRDDYCLCHQGTDDRGSKYLKMLVIFYKIKWHNISEDILKIAVLRI
jgi:hypothetical protein